MPVIKPTCIRDIKMRVNIADVVSRVVTLRKAGGGRLKGLCPFHNEKTPSFNVDADKGFYKCFGCGKAGDAITFVRETEQLSFTEAIEALGKRFGIPIEYEEGSGGPSREERSLRQEIFDLHDVAAEHFYQAMRAKDATGDAMRALWTEKRRFGMEIADDFKIGAAAPDGSGLGAALLRRKFSEEALRRCGLFFLYDDAAVTLHSLRPRFRGRLMIPIRDHQGRVVAFTARQTDLTPPDDPAREAKYVNSPETPIFTKGNLLFNLDRARTAAGDGNPFVMVEGQLDAIRCWSVGLKTAIAPQGTSITESQLVLLRRYHTQVECFFDSDSAGQKAALRFLPMALKAGLEVRFLAAAGDGKVDPDVLFLEKGIAAYAEVRAHAQSAMTFACRAILPDAMTASPEHKARAAQTAFEIVANAESEVARAEFVNEVASHLRFPTGAAQKDFQAYLQRRARQAAGRPANFSPQVPPPSPPPSSQPAPPPFPSQSPDSEPPHEIGDSDESFESASSAGAVTGIGATGVTGNAFPASPFPASITPGQPHPHTPEYHLLLLFLHFDTVLGRPLALFLPHHWIDANPRHTAAVLLNRFLAEFEHGDWPGRDHLDALLETPEERALVANLLFETPAVEDPHKVAQEGLRLLRARALEPRLRQIELALANPHADSESDPISLLKERSELQRQLRQPIVLPAAS